MTEFLDWLAQNPVAIVVIVAAFVILIVIYILAFVQGRELSFWPPKIGEKPNLNVNQKGDVPAAPEVKVSREHYLRDIIEESSKPNTDKILLLSSGLKSRSVEPLIANLQNTWGRLNTKTSIRVLAHLSDANLKGACELLSKGVSVRFIDTSGIDYLSFHVFRGAGAPRVILNRKDDDNPEEESPILFVNVALARIVEDYFEKLWARSIAISEILTSKVHLSVSLQGSRSILRQALHDVETSSGADKTLIEQVKLRVALRRISEIVFVIGLPGAGKTTLRNKLRAFFVENGILVTDFADYPILYELFIKERLQTNESRANDISRFKPDKYGGFEILDETVFKEADQKLKEVCLSHVHRRNFSSLSEPTHIIIVELARSQYRETMNEFGESIVGRSQLIYVTGTQSERIIRIENRVGEPYISREDGKIVVSASDNHYISQEAIHKLYSGDDIEALWADTRFSDRIHHLDTTNAHQGTLDDWILNFLSTLQTNVWGE